MFIPKIGQYYYSLRGDSYRIYRCNSSDGVSFGGEALPGSYHDRESAARRVRSLNGWSINRKTPVTNG